MLATGGIRAHRLFAVVTAPPRNANALFVETITVVRAVVHARRLVAGIPRPAWLARAEPVNAGPVAVAIVGTILNVATGPLPTMPTIALIVEKHPTVRTVLRKPLLLRLSNLFIGHGLDGFWLGGSGGVVIENGAGVGVVRLRVGGINVGAGG